MAAQPAAPARVSFNVIACAIAALLSAAAAAFLLLISQDTLRAWIVSVYSSHADLTADGWTALNGTLGKIKMALAAAALGWVGLGAVIFAAERQSREQRSSSAIAPGEPAWPGADRIAVALLAVLALGLALVRASDSFYGDELNTASRVASAPLADIFGLHPLSPAYTSNNHVLNTLLTKLLLEFGARSELVLRSWSLCAFAALVVCTYWLARLAGAASRPALSAAALAATSPMLVQYGAALRGYELAALFSTAALAFHVRWLRSERRRDSLACAVSGALAVLANVTAAPVVIVILLHTLLLPFDAKGVQPPRSRAYSTHLTALVAFLVAGIALQVLLLPRLVAASVLWAVPLPLSAKLMRFVSGAAAGLMPDGFRYAIAVGAVVLIAVFVVAARAWSSRGWTRTVHGLIAMMSFAGVAAFVGAGMDTRTAVYFAPTLLVVIALAAWPAHEGGNPQSLAAATVLAALCCLGAYHAATRPETSNIRGVIASWVQRGGDRGFWTSTDNDQVADYVRFYAPKFRTAHTIADIPAGATQYLRFEPASHEHDALLEFTNAHCKAVEHAPPPNNLTLFECPDLHSVGK